LDKVLKNIGNAKARKLKFSYQMHFCRRLQYPKAGSGAGTEISGCGSSTRRLQNDLVENHCLICTVVLQYCNNI